MSNDEPDLELLRLLRESMGLGQKARPAKPGLVVLRDAEIIYNNATDVAVDMYGTKAAANTIYEQMSKAAYSTKFWKQQALHPTTADDDAVRFIFLMDLLNFSFWSDSQKEDEGFAVEYQGKTWKGYRALVAAIRRALDDGIPITDARHWNDEATFTFEHFSHIFRSATEQPMPLLKERYDCVREASNVLKEKFNGSFLNCLEQADHSAAALVDILFTNFPSFDDRHVFEDRLVSFHKRAQILVADLWACFDGKDRGSFSDIDDITMFADYRIPQMLHSLGCLNYSPPLNAHIHQRRMLASGHNWEIQLRGCSIWAVELIKREISRQHPDFPINAILIDFFMYDTVKEMEANGLEMIPHHRTRSIYY